MLPPCADNYGAESCSIVCLPSQPEVLALADTTGRLHHCIALAENQVCFDVRGINSLYWHCKLKDQVYVF